MNQKNTKTLKCFLSLDASTSLDERRTLCLRPLVVPRRQVVETDQGIKVVVDSKAARKPSEVRPQVGEKRLWSYMAPHGAPLLYPF